VKSLQRNVIEAEIATGHHKGRRIFIPRIILLPAESYNVPFKLRRGQFPIRLAFALTINKAQGQTIPSIGIFLPDHVFCHGQLYVAMSRAQIAGKVKIMVRYGKLEDREGTWTRNIVYKEALQSPL
jgi:ATP-dependent DNA helicase PIF1